MLVPLTASLYVPGTLDDSEKVLVDVGTGYFIEVSHLGSQQLRLCLDFWTLAYGWSMLNVFSLVD